ncbi:MAG TPA: AAA family ATPase [Roseiflexaceae bacterium]|nr:AAA family ATPase [Roseiflexaceae bacterium]
MQQHVSNGQIIVLNGTSSAGKSTLAKALQNLLPEPYLHIGIDTVIFALPKRYLNPPLWHEVFRYTWPPDGSSEGLAIDAGPLGHQLIGGLHLSVAALARAGNRVIVDHVLLERAWVGECARLLGDLPALFVGVLCPLDVVEQRERDRKDRTLGQARAQFWRVHAHGTYDLTVDTAQHSPEECAEQIRRGLMPGRRSTAFEQLRAQDWGEYDG